MGTGCGPGAVGATRSHPAIRARIPATIHPVIAIRFGGRASGSVVAAATVWVVKWGSFSAAAKAAAVSKRSALNRSSALAVAAATWGGTVLRNRVTGWASSVTIFMMICCAEVPRWGGSPVSIS